MKHCWAHCVCVCVCVCFLLPPLLCVFVFVVFLYVSVDNVGRLRVSVLLTFYIWYVFIERFCRTACDPVDPVVFWTQLFVICLFVEKITDLCFSWKLLSLMISSLDSVIVRQFVTFRVPRGSRGFYRVSGGFKDGRVFLVRQNSDQLLCS